MHHENPEARGFLPSLDQAEKELLKQLSEVEGAQVERKKFAIAIHFRNVPEEHVKEVEQSVDSVASKHDNFDPEQEGLREALCTLGNGYFATRGAAPESADDDVHYPGTYLAGGYNRLKTEIADRVIENEDLVNLPNWLVLEFRIEGGNGSTCVKWRSSVTARSWI